MCCPYYPCTLHLPTHTMHLLLFSSYHTHPISSSFHYTLHILIILFLYFETCTSSSSYTLHLQVLSIYLPTPPPLPVPCTSSCPLTPYIFSSYCYTSSLYIMNLAPLLRLLNLYLPPLSILVVNRNTFHLLQLYVAPSPPPPRLNTSSPSTLHLLLPSPCRPLTLPLTHHSPSYCYLLLLSDLNPSLCFPLPSLWFTFPAFCCPPSP